MTLFVYWLITFVFIVLVIRTGILLYKERTQLLTYFFWSFLILTIFQLFSNFLITFYPTSISLYWVDVISRLAMLVSASVIVQVPLSFYWPKSRFRYFISVAIVLYAIGVTLFNLSLNYSPFIDEKSGIIHWETPSSLALLFGIVLLSTWLFAGIALLREYVRSRYKSLKMLFFGLGFVVGVIGGVAQDFGTTTIEYFLINLILVIGFGLILAGLLIEEN